MTENTNTNPLEKYYRQPAIYIKLPSEGRYYDKNTFMPTETGEIPILPMTAKDELTFKTVTQELSTIACMIEYSNYPIAPYCIQGMTITVCNQAL